MSAFRPLRRSAEELATIFGEDQHSIVDATEPVPVNYVTDPGQSGSMRTNSENEQHMSREIEADDTPDEINFIAGFMIKESIPDGILTQRSAEKLLGEIKEIAKDEALRGRLVALLNVLNKIISGNNDGAMSKLPPSFQGLSDDELHAVAYVIQEALYG
ncbi:hypothetical protein KC614_04560 [candidate division WWE3 bacterium]|uniref:Uncharacterized protein n=1 Tax=candidate division WWE3 bacterium TaxID=2053526 RepID=A0A955LM61_UNCKA|nr:hypothetical protein [candidate division WWE3 bacterium]